MQDRKSLTPNRRLSINHISPAGSGIVTFRPSPTQSPANIVNVGNEFNTTLIGSNNISLNKVNIYATYEILKLIYLFFFSKRVKGHHNITINMYHNRITVRKRRKKYWAGWEVLLQVRVQVQL